MMAPRQFQDRAESIFKKPALLSTKPDEDQPCPHCLQRSLGNSFLSDRGNQKAAFTETPINGDELPPGVALLQQPAADATPGGADLEKKPKPCCDYDSFTASGDTYTESAIDCRKNIKFTFKVKSGGDGHKCALVNWVQGTAKNKDGTFITAKLFDKTTDINFADSRIDSMDTDPVYWSNSTGRWNYKSGGTDTFFATDSPGPPTWVDGMDFDLKFKMCLYCIDDVDAGSDEKGSGVKNPLKCIDWVFKAKFDAAAGKFDH
jgi:hypothetical protein